MIGFLLQFLTLATPIVLGAWALALLIDHFGLIDDDFDPDGNYDWDQEPFGGELR